MANEPIDKAYCDMVHHGLNERLERMDNKTDRILEKLEDISKFIQNHEFRITGLEREKENVKKTGGKLIWWIMGIIQAVIISLLIANMGFGGC